MHQKSFAHMICLGLVSLALTIAPGPTLAEPLSPDKAVELAAKLYNDLTVIDDAAAAYRAELGVNPANLAELRNECFLRKPPTMGPELGNGVYELLRNYDNIDGKGESDAAIYTTVEVPMEVCVEYNKRYASAPLNDGTVFDFDAHGKYPTALYGYEFKTFAIKWQTPPGCQINWVLQYK